MHQAAAPWHCCPLKKETRPAAPLCQAEALPDTLPEQLVWCGSDAVLLFWEASARLVGGHPVGGLPCPLAAQRSACGAARQGCTFQCCRLAYRSAEIHSVIAPAFCLQSVGGLLVTLDGAWRWWDLGAGAAAAFATEVDGGCAVTAGWLCSRSGPATAAVGTQQAVSAGLPGLIVTSYLRMSHPAALPADSLVQACACCHQTGTCCCAACRPPLRPAWRLAAPRRGRCCTMLAACLMPRMRGPQVGGCRSTAVWGLTVGGGRESCVVAPSACSFMVSGHQPRAAPAIAPPSGGSLHACALHVGFLAHFAQYPMQVNCWTWCAPESFQGRSTTAWPQQQPSWIRSSRQPC